MVKLDRIEHIVTIPEGVNAEISEDGVVTVTGPKGSLSRTFVSTFIELFKDGSGITVRVDVPRRKQRALAGTWNAHLSNMIKGVTRIHLQLESLLLSLSHDPSGKRRHIQCQQLLWRACPTGSKNP